MNLDQDVLEAARSLARQENISLGSAINRLARRGLNAQPDRARYLRSGELPSFSIAGDAPVFGTEDVKRALEEG